MYRDKLMNVNEQQEKRREIDKIKRARQLMYSDEIR